MFSTDRNVVIIQVNQVQEACVHIGTRQPYKLKIKHINSLKPKKKQLIQNKHGFFQWFNQSTLLENGL